MRKIIALIIGGSYFIFILLTCDVYCIFRMSAGIVLVLSLILYSEEWGNYTGFIGIFHPRITSRSPEWMVESIGWLLLLLPIFLFIYKAIRELIF